MTVSEIFLYALPIIIAIIIAINQKKQSKNDKSQLTKEILSTKEALKKEIHMLSEKMPDVGAYFHWATELRDIHKIKLLESAIRALNNDEYFLSIDLLRYYLNLFQLSNPDKASILAMIGIALRELNKYEEALAAFDESLALDPNNIRIWYYKGITYSCMNIPEEAINAYEEYLKYCPNDAYAWNNIGTAYGFLFEHAEAAKAYKKALESDPKNKIYLVNYGGSLFAQKRNEEALEIANIVLEENNQEYMAWHLRGLALKELKQFDEALKAADMEILLHPNNYPGYILKTNLLGILGRIDAAIYCVDQAINIDGTNSAGYVYRARLNSIKRDKRKVLEDIYRALMVDPDIKREVFGYTEFEWLRKDKEYLLLCQKYDIVDAAPNPDSPLGIGTKGIWINKDRKV